MVETELASLLIQHGVDEKTAQQLQNNINGTDLINLVNDLKDFDSHETIQRINAILSRYGAKIGEGKMNKNFDKLSALYRGTEQDSISEHSLPKIEWLLPMSESENSEDHLLALEGFNYYTKLDSQLGEELTDWLENNKIEFLTDGQGHFHIKCEDRDHAYRVGRTISGIVRKKKLVRDSSNTGEETMAVSESPNAQQRINQAKKKLAGVKPRDPNGLAASMMQAKSGGPMDPRRKIDQKDKYGRSAKHKGGRSWNEEIDYSIGENVIVGDRQGTVKIPHGPDNTIGVIMDGVLSMVDRADIARLDESVMGLTNISPLFRLRELAGLPPAPAVEPKPEGMPDDALDVVEPTLDTDIGNTELPAPEMPGLGVPGDLPPEGPEVVASNPPNSSDAMNEIEDHLNNIQLKLSDIRLSEYRTLVQKLQDLTNQIQAMGRDYLGERRKKNAVLGI